MAERIKVDKEKQEIVLNALEPYAYNFICSFDSRKATKMDFRLMANAILRALEKHSRKVNG